MLRRRSSRKPVAGTIEQMLAEFQERRGITVSFVHRYIVQMMYSINNVTKSDLQLELKGH